MALKIVAGTVAIVLFCLAVAWLYPATRTMARRSQTSDLILAATLFKGEIEARARARQSLAGAGKGLSVAPSGPITGGSISDDGVIVVRGNVDGHPVEIGLKPYLKGASVEWRCRGLKGIEGWFTNPKAYFAAACPMASSLDPF